VVAQLGDDADRIRGDQQFQIRSDPGRWNDGRFVHPHDACFDQQGNIFVAEWVATGRVFQTPATWLSRAGGNNTERCGRASLPPFSNGRARGSEKKRLKVSPCSSSIVDP